MLEAFGLSQCSKQSALFGEDWLMLTHLPRLPALPPTANVIQFLERELDWEPADRELASALDLAGLPPLATVRTLPFILGVSHSIVNRMRHAPSVYYREFSIPKRSGGARTIRAPRVALKVVQRWLHEHVLSVPPTSTVATGYSEGTGIIENAGRHVGARNLLQIDLVDFFGSVTPEQVSRVFESLGFSEPVSRQLTDLTVYGGLPQGAPSSPLLSNLVARGLDDDLVTFAAEVGSTVTRYADDITLSSSTHRFSADDVDRLRQIVEAHNFRLNTSKTRLIGGGYRHVVTGLSTSSRVQYPRAKRREWRRLFHLAAKAPTEYAGRRAEMIGIAAAVFAYDPETGAQYREIARSIPQT